jgi:uncharacterized protein YggE
MTRAKSRTEMEGNMNRKAKRKLISLAFSISVLCTACGSAVEGSANGPAGSETIPETVSAAPATNTNVSSANSERNVISVNSSETITVVPDIAEIVYAVRTEAKDAASCQQKNTEDVAKVIELLKGLGVEETSIQTSDYYMYPIYNYSGNTQRITGYEASTSLTVSKLPIDSLDTILAQSVQTGINNIQSITYMSSKYDEGYSNALKLAMESARAKAEALAEAGGCSLGSVVGVRENSNYSEARYTDNALSSKMRSMESLAAGAEDGSSIMPGEVAVEVNITVEYLILP